MAELGVIEIHLKQLIDVSWSFAARWCWLNDPDLVASVLSRRDSKQTKRSVNVQQREDVKTIKKD